MSTKIINNIPTAPISKKRANKISEDLRNYKPGMDDPDGYYAALFDEAQRWRAQHALPTKNCFKTLLSCAQGFDEPVLSFRLKRMTSILSKLKRPGKDYQLGTMDDIGGCRLVLRDMEQVDDAIVLLSERFDLKGGNAIKNYIERPRQSGYRSFHLVTMNPGEDRAYRVEVQIRTQLQHLLATSVEAAGTIYETDVKTEQPSGMEESINLELRRFFQIVSSLFSLEEGTPQVAGLVKTEEELAAMLSALPRMDEILNDLERADDGVFVVGDGASNKNAPGLYLMEFDTEKQVLNTRGYGDELGKALRAYDACEDEMFAADPRGADSRPFVDAVLAYAQTNSQLELAYPNYSTRVGSFASHVRTYLR